jgi:hypothetical protein
MRFEELLQRISGGVAGGSGGDAGGLLADVLALRYRLRGEGPEGLDRQAAEQGAFGLRGLSGEGRWPRRSCACRERYAGFTVKHFREELQQRHRRKKRPRRLV